MIDVTTQQALSQVQVEKRTVRNVSPERSISNANIGDPDRAFLGSNGLLVFQWFL